MSNFPLSLLLLSVLLLPLPAHAKVITSSSESELPAGSVVMTAGDVFAVSSEGGKERVQSQRPFFSGEVLKTRKNSVAEIEFSDGSVLNLGPKTHAALREYMYDTNSQAGKITVKIEAGVYRFSKGKMRPGRPLDIQIEFPAGGVAVQNATVLGQVNENRSLVILGEVENESGIDRVITVRNKVSAQFYETRIFNVGYGSLIKDKNLPPTPAAKVPPSDIDWIHTQLMPPAPKAPERVQETPEEDSGFSIQAIVYDQEAQAGGKLVVVDGQLYEEGAIVNGHEILSIQPASVKIRDLATDEIKTVGIEAAAAEEIEKTKEELHVVSIFYDAQNPKNNFAYINGILSREGDSAPLFKVLEIKPYGVTVVRTGAAEPEVIPLEKTQTVEAAPELVPLFLQSIAYDHNPQKSFATINGKSYRRGELVEGHALVQISADAVWIQKDPAKKPEKITLEKGQEEAGDERPKMDIQVILYNQREPRQSQVAIGSTLYKAGDLVEGYEILEVHKTYIRVRKKLRLPWRSYIIWELKN